MPGLAGIGLTAHDVQDAGNALLLFGKPGGEPGPDACDENSQNGERPSDFHLVAVGSREEIANGEVSVSAVDGDFEHEGAKVGFERRAARDYLRSRPALHITE